MAPWIGFEPIFSAPITIRSLEDFLGYQGINIRSANITVGESPKVI